MTPEPPHDAISEPTLEDLLKSVFDMSETELEVCLCVMEGGEITTQELADQIDYDRSVVTRHLNHLAELGVIKKHRRLLREGGRVHVYKPVPPEQVRQRLAEAFATWVHGATKQIAALQKKKVASIAASDDDPSWRIFRES
jgi:predicted transcriptional regulator